jgi:hypothetical protein
MSQDEISMIERRILKDAISKDAFGELGMLKDRLRGLNAQEIAAIEYGFKEILIDYYSIDEVAARQVLTLNACESRVGANLCEFVILGCLGHDNS